MLNNSQKNILKKAIQIRVNNGEDIKTVIDSYSKLSVSDRDDLMKSMGVKYDLSLEELKNKKIEEFSKICKEKIEEGVYLDFGKGTEHFTYSIDGGDQENINTLFNLAISTKIPQPYHSVGNDCRLYTADEIIELYISVNYLKAKETTYFNQIKQYILSLPNKAFVDNVQYGENLVGEYLTKYNEMLEQSQNIIQALIKE